MTKLVHKSLYSSAKVNLYVLTEWGTLSLVHVLWPLLDLMHVCSYTAFIYCFCSVLLYYFGVKIDIMDLSCVLALFSYMNEMSVFG